MVGAADGDCGLRPRHGRCRIGRWYTLSRKDSFSNQDLQSDTDRKWIAPRGIWNDKKTKDEPVKDNDHGMDALRYAVMYVDPVDDWVWTGDD